MRATVFTPTFNRAATLHRVYESLCQQNVATRTFEWVVVDDGSTDTTKDLVESWARSAPFPIRYFWQENGGKHRAWNRGVSVAEGELFVCIDSDDALLPDSLHRLFSHWDSLTEAEREIALGICGHRC